MKRYFLEERTDPLCKKMLNPDLESLSHPTEDTPESRQMTGYLNNAQLTPVAVHPEARVSEISSTNLLDCFPIEGRKASLLGTCTPRRICLQSRDSAKFKDPDRITGSLIWAESSTPRLSLCSLILPSSLSYTSIAVFFCTNIQISIMDSAWAEKLADLSETDLTPSIDVLANDFRQKCGVKGGNTWNKPNIRKGLRWRQALFDYYFFLFIFIFRTFSATAG